MWTNQQHTKDLGDKRGQFSDWNRGDACHILYSDDLWKHCDWADWVCGTGTDAACMFVSADLLHVVVPSIIFFCFIQNKMAGGLSDGAVK